MSDMLWLLIKGWFVLGVFVTLIRPLLLGKKSYEVQKEVSYEGYVCVGIWRIGVNILKLAVLAWIIWWAK